MRRSSRGGRCGIGEGGEKIWGVSAAAAAATLADVNEKRERLEWKGEVACDRREGVEFKAFSRSLSFFQTKRRLDRRA